MIHEAVPVLILGAGSPVGLGLTRSLVESPWPLLVHTADPDPWVESLLDGHCHHRLPWVNDAGYRSRLVDLCRHEGIRGVFVCSHAELNYLSEHRDAIEKQVEARILVSRRSIIQQMADKWSTFLWLKEQGFPVVPTIALPASDEDLSAFLEAVDYPIIIKPRRGTGSRGLMLVQSPSELRQALLCYSEPAILQQHVEGHEFTAGVTRARDGTIVTSVVLQRRLRHGVTWRARLAPFNAERAFAERVTTALGAEGPCNVQFRYSHGEPIVFDVNVRWSSSTRMRTLGGVNEGARLAAHELLDISLPPVQFRTVDVVRTWCDRVLPDDTERPEP